MRHGDRQINTGGRDVHLVADRKKWYILGVAFASSVKDKKTNEKSFSSQ